MLEYKGYVGTVAYDDVAEVLYAKVINSGPYSVAEAEATDVEGIRGSFASLSTCTWLHALRTEWSRCHRPRYLSSRKRQPDSQVPLG